MNPHESIQLLLVVEVDKSDRIYCQSENCKHAVFKQIHVVRDNDELKLYGSSCFAKKYHDLPSSFKVPLFSSRPAGSVLSAEERQMLTDNTEKLLAIFRQEFEGKERIRVAVEARKKQEAERSLAQKIEATMKDVEKKNKSWQQPKLNVQQKNSPNKVRSTDRFDEQFLDEIRAFEVECEIMSPQFSEQQFMRSMWATTNDRTSDTIRDYANGVNRTRVIDLIIRYFGIGTSSDPWGFSVQLQSSYSIPKIVTFQVLSDFGLLRVI